MTWPRIELVQRWCAFHLDPTSPDRCLRHRELLPDATLADDSSKLCDALLADPERLIGYITARQQQLPPAPARSHAGRLMICQPALNRCDGAAAAESNGYLDDDNAPPWDTWIAWLPGPRTGAREGSLVAWVPDAFCAAVDRGIYVNPEQCIAWLRRW